MILEKRKLPLIEVDPNGSPQDACLSFREESGHIEFVAVSHVWADGRGNVKNNSLPACSLQEVSKLVQCLPSSNPKLHRLIPFWIDTVCVPVEPVELKILALTYLKDPYQQAKHVLVLDSYIRSFSSHGRSMLEIISLLSCSNWVARLWTLQEGQLAKKVWFQFKDRAIDLESLWADFREPTAAGTMCLYFKDLSLSAISSWYATKFLENDNFEHRGRKDQVIEGSRLKLWSRSVSVPSDEALYLFSLAKFI